MRISTTEKRETVAFFLFSAVECVAWPRMSSSKKSFRKTETGKNRREENPSQWRLSPQARASLIKGRICWPENGLGKA